MVSGIATGKECGGSRLGLQRSIAGLPPADLRRGHDAQDELHDDQRVQTTFERAVRGEAVQGRMTVRDRAREHLVTRLVGVKAGIEVLLKLVETISRPSRSVAVVMSRQRRFLSSDGRMPVLQATRIRLYAMVRYQMLGALVAAFTHDRPTE